MVNGRRLWIDNAYVRDVVTRQSWDLSGRLIAQEDDNGNTTTYEPDEVGRVGVTRLADGSEYVSRWDAFGNLAATLDPNGTSVSSKHDLLGRRVRREVVTLGQGVADVVEPETFTFDGLGRLVAHGREDGLGRQARFRHDSRGNVLEASDGSCSRTHAYDLASRRTFTCYGGSGLRLRFERTDLDRLRRIWLSDLAGAPDCSTPPGTERLVLEHEYIGPRVARRTYGNGVRLDIEWDWDLARFRDTAWHLDGAGVRTDLYEREYHRNDVHVTSAMLPGETGNPGVEYGHDSLRRMTWSQVLGAPDPLAYDLDGAGNRLAVTQGGASEDYAQQGDDALLNQYTTVGGMGLLHDRNGNVRLREPMTGDPRRRLELQFDALNRPASLVVGDAAQPDARVTLEHDALGRRIARAVAGAGGHEEISYFHDGENVVEQRDEATGKVTLHVYGGMYLDDLVLRTDGAEEAWFLTDAQSSVVRVHDVGWTGRPCESMMRGMTAVKIAISLPPPAVERARAAVRAGRARSVSAYIAAALEEKAKLDDVAGLLDEMLAESGGPLTAAEKARAERAFRGGRRGVARGGRRK